MKKILSNLIFGTVIFICGYLTIANILHIVYLNNYDTFDFNSNIMKDIRTKISILESSVEKVSKLDNTVFEEEDLMLIKNNLNTAIKTINSNKLLSYSGTNKIYLIDLLSIDLTNSSNVSGNIKMLETLSKYDSSITNYIDVYKSDFLNNAYNGDAAFRESTLAYKYNTPSFSSDNVLVVPNVKILARIYNLNNHVTATNYFTTLILKIGGVNNE